MNFMIKTYELETNDTIQSSHSFIGWTLAPIELRDLPITDKGIGSFTIEEKTRHTKPLKNWLSSTKSSDALAKPMLGRNNFQRSDEGCCEASRNNFQRSDQNQQGKGQIYLNTIQFLARKKIV
jgi:hypothetical protein